MDLEPLFQRIIVKRKEVKTWGNLVIPEGCKQMEATEGVVLSVGSECTDVKPDDVVFFGRYSGVEIERNSVKYVVMNEEDVIAKVVPVN